LRIVKYFQLRTSDDGDMVEISKLSKVFLLVLMLGILFTCPYILPVWFLVYRLLHYTPEVQPVKKPKFIDLVIFGDYFDVQEDWNGSHAAAPIAVYKGEVIVRLFTVQDVSRNKYWEGAGTVAYHEAQRNNNWLPLLIANLICDEIASGGSDYFVAGEFLAEAITRNDQSLLIVDSSLLAGKSHSFYSIYHAKRVLCKSTICKFFDNYVVNRKTRTLAQAFLEEEISLEEASWHTFDVFNRRVRSERVEKVSGAVLNRLVGIMHWKYKCWKCTAGSRLTKAFLSAYLIVEFPYRFFDVVGFEETVLRTAAMRMIAVFHATVLDLAAGIPWHVIWEKHGAECLRFIYNYFVLFQV
jgi:hypothetical protein